MIVDQCFAQPVSILLKERKKKRKRDRECERECKKRYIFPT